MALTPPEQIRSIDPYSENRFSSTINRFTRIYTGGTDCIVHPDSFQITDASDSTSVTYIAFTSGMAIKDDVLIHITESGVGVDLLDDTHYLDETPGPITEGYYYLVLWYNHTRSYPAPKA